MGCIALLSGCADKNDDLEFPMVRIIEPGGAEVEARKAELCDPSLINFNEDLITEENYLSIFDCANYDHRFDGLSPLFHHPKFPEFVEDLLDAMNTIGFATETSNIREMLEPWFAEDESGNSRVDTLLPLISEIIQHNVFRRALPLLATILDFGSAIWRDVLPALADLVYNERYPDLYHDFRRLFNVRTLPMEGQLVAQNTRELFYFFSKTNDDKTNAKRILELADDLNGFTQPRNGILYELGSWTSQGVFAALYQEASWLQRREHIHPDLNQSEEERLLKEESLFVGGYDAPLNQLLGVITAFNKDRPNFLHAILQWFNNPENEQFVNDSLYSFVARRLVGDIVNDLAVENYLWGGYLGYILHNEVVDPGTGENCTSSDKRRCRIDATFFTNFLTNAFANPLLIRWLDEEIYRLNVDTFGERNARLVFAHGGLREDLLDLYRQPEVAALGAAVVESLGRRPRLGPAVSAFSTAHKQEVNITTPSPTDLYFEWQGEYGSFREHLIRAWIKNTQAAWGDSIIVQEAFRVARLALTEIETSYSNGPAEQTLSKWFLRSTYTNPDFLEMLAREGRRSGLLTNLPEQMRWLKEDFAPEVFVDENDRQAFIQAVNQIPNFLKYIESGMARSGTNLLRIISERDQGEMLYAWVDLICQAHARGWFAKFIPIWRDFSDFTRALEERTSAASALYYSTLSVANQQREKDAERWRLYDGVNALETILSSLIRPERDGDYSTSLLGNFLTALRPLAKSDRRDETESFILELSNRVQSASDADIKAVYDFFSPDGPDGIAESRDRRKSMAELMRDRNFSHILIELDQFFKDEAVIPALDFVAENIDNDSIPDFLELIRRILGIHSSRD